MPFTISHVAAVLPLRRFGLAPSALVLGCMAPDLPYFLPLPVTPHSTHAWTGPLGADVLLGLAAYLAWFGFFARPAFDVMPPALRARIPQGALVGLRSRLASPARLVLLALSLSAGAATHVVWDSFTHPGNWGTEHVAWLHDKQGPMLGSSWAQYASGVVGLIVLGVWCAVWLARRPGTTDSTATLGTRGAAAAWGSIATVGLVWGIWQMRVPLQTAGGPYIREAAVVLAISSITGVIVASSALSVVWHAARLRRSQ